MSLYDRNYANDSILEKSQELSLRAAFVKQTYQLLAASLLAATAGAYLGTEYIKTPSVMLIILEIALLIGLMFSRKNESLALVLLFAFTFVSGLTLGPVLNFYVANGMGKVVTQAFLMTTVAFGSLSVFAFNTKRDFSAMGKFLLIALIVLVVGALINLFVGSSVLSLVLSGVGAVLFSAYILFDTQMIIRGGYDSPILAAVALYLDILNLFTSLLNILGFLNKD